MTYNGPPGPSRDGGYGPSPSSDAGQSSGTTSHPKSSNALDWAVIAAGVLALVFSFFSYYSYSINRGAAAKAIGTPVAVLNRLCAHLNQVSAGDQASAEKFCNGQTTSAWHGFFGWFGIVLAVVGAVLLLVTVIAAQVRLPFPARLVAAALLALGFLSTLIALFVIPTAGKGGTQDGISYDAVVKQSHGFSYWIVLVLTLAGTVITVVRFQQTGGALPSRGTAGGAPGQPGYGPRQQQYGPPQQQYGPPIPPQGYQESPPDYQQPPPPGYQPQQPPPPAYPPPPQ